MLPYYSRLLLCAALAAALFAPGAIAEESEPPRTIAETVPPEEAAPAPDPDQAETASETPAAPTDATADANADANAETVVVKDLTADRPDAKKPAKSELIESITTNEPMNDAGTKAYKLIAEMKANLDRISEDLDNGGKEITRLLRTTDDLSKNITDVVGVWPENERLRDECSSAKRCVLILNDELARVPRHWTHVRWAFNDSVKSVGLLRYKIRDLADAEPKPIRVVGKNGKVSYVEPPPPPVDPALARREEKIRKVEEVKARAKAMEEERNRKTMPIDLDGN